MEEESKQNTTNTKKSRLNTHRCLYILHALVCGQGMSWDYGSQYGVIAVRSATTLQHSHSNQRYPDGSHSQTREQTPTNVCFFSSTAAEFHRVQGQPEGRGTELLRHVHLRGHIR